MQSPQHHTIPHLYTTYPARRRYRIQSEFLAANGALLIPNSKVSLTITDEINAIQREESAPQPWIRSSELYAAALLSTAVHQLILNFGQFGEHSHTPSDFSENISRRLGTSRLQDLSSSLTEAFHGPMDEAAMGPMLPDEILDLLVFLYWAQKNPALDPLRSLFEEGEQLPVCPEVFPILEKFLSSSRSNEPEIKTSEPDLLSLLLGPIRHAPTSLEAQLRFVMDNWSPWISELEGEILAALDFLREETRPRFPPGPGPVEIPNYAQTEADAPEAFSEDVDWMPRVVLLAKNAYVWMAQLSTEYGRVIQRLDEIPEETLDRLASRGFTALWLIGVWERSRASEKIKRWMGDTDAVASAYSLDDYRISDRLGGDPAWDELSRRASERGIRLMTDMVPNHVGIDGRWVIEHPDWFIGLPESPFPSYRFTGADLCEDERVGITIEDGYWDHSDAAVVFKRVDYRTGSTHYIYHGNDGTSMPWNDTAQLDYRKEEVREAVIQTILHVARRSPMIRFDAAMTLTRENFRRLWFPEPGHGGDIPSRSAHAMNREDFDRMMPREFWREVVDRVAHEAPDTLLLAEAFWMLEGYFVRSLGMHRVYNSAFMNMLRDERNDEYRRLIRETLEFDPRILSRYVNFMSNPDEETAVEGFGKGDKYFGICTLMATMPGLPMFGHGQVEGYAEKYGMEFHRPRWSEEVDRELLAAHHRLIFPLLRNRASFSGVESFRLYDFETPGGEINENVFVYSNGHEFKRSLVVVNNSYGSSRGRVRRAVPTRRMRGDAPGELIHPSLAEGLQLDSSALFLRMRDLVTGLEYISDLSQLREEGLQLDLKGYEYHVYHELQEIRNDPGGHWQRLTSILRGRGCPDLSDRLGDIRFVEILTAWKELAREMFKNGIHEESERRVLRLLATIRIEFPSEEPLSLKALEFLEAVSARKLQQECQPETGLPASILRISDALHHLRYNTLRTIPESDRRLLLEKFRKALDESAPEGTDALPSILLILLDGLREASDSFSPTEFLLDLLEREDIGRLLQIHTWEGRTYFRQEGADCLLRALDSTAEILRQDEEIEDTPQRLLESGVLLRRAIASSEWDLVRLRETLRDHS